MGKICASRWCQPGGAAGREEGRPVRGRQRGQQPKGGEPGGHVEEDKQRVPRVEIVAPQMVQAVAVQRRPRAGCDCVQQLHRRGSAPQQQHHRQRTHCRRGCGGGGRCRGGGGGEGRVSAIVGWQCSQSAPVRPRSAKESPRQFPPPHMTQRRFGATGSPSHCWACHVHIGSGGAVRRAWSSPRAPRPPPWSPQPTVVDAVYCCRIQFNVVWCCHWHRRGCPTRLDQQRCRGTGRYQRRQQPHCLPHVAQQHMPGGEPPGQRLGRRHGEEKKLALQTAVRLHNHSFPQTSSAAALPVSAQCCVTMFSAWLSGWRC